MTAGINESIPKQDILTILQDLHSFVEAEQGIDYLQVYTHQETGQVIWIIDQVTATTKRLTSNGTQSCSLMNINFKPHIAYVLYGVLLLCL